MAAVRLRPLAIIARGALRTHAATPKILQATPWHITKSLPFSTSTLRRAPTQSHTEADSRNKKSYEREDLDARKTAQRLVDDRPWHREDSHSQPEATSSDPTGHDQTKGRLLTTPTRLLKLILPMPFHPEQHHLNETETDETARGSEPEVVEPLAILVHPQQPLSYLERLIQAEIPPLLVKNREKLPDISFRAEADREESRKKQNNNGVDNVATYSGLGREGPDKDRSSVDWVRWSGSTEVGDFIRDAARGREFAINIEGYGRELRVAVPSFKDRTHYMRMRLRRMSREIDRMSKLKNECDQLAHKGAHRIAQGGFAALAGWWGVVYYVTFHTEMGWDLVEPVTYLAGLTTIMGGYLWFLYMSRDLSYKAAMNVTVSRRQNALYQDRGFDITTWEHLVHEANALRREIKYVAGEYDVDWNETKDLGGQEVKDVLESEESKDDDDSEKKKNNKHNEQSSKSNEKPPPEDKRGEQRASG